MHLWLNLSGLKEKYSYFLIDAPVSSAGLFRAAVETVVRTFREAKVKSVTFEHYIPRCRRHPFGQPSEAEPAAGPSWRQSQKASVAARAWAATSCKAETSGNLSKPRKASRSPESKAFYLFSVSFR